MHSDMPDSLHQWESTRRMGRNKYAVLYGSLGWGIPTGIIATGVMSCMDGHAPQNLAVWAVAWAIGGFLVGRFRWVDTEQRYLKFQAGRFSTPNRSTDPTLIRSPLVRGKRSALH